ncbi:hypothetical protein GCM10009789_82760 [Kribbella sancticallisti]|uniref:CSD domain-containing protein n=1 Tax=Kribbella sancticallisti TaxID=460087 RepID=A0ABN2ESA1_9ACTN
MDADPSWEPLVELPEQVSFAVHNLPSPEYDETGLVGRSTEVQQLIELLNRRREPVITITGEGGIGKTALAIQVASELADDPARPFEAILWTSLKNEKLTANGIRDIAGAAQDLTGAIVPLGQALDTGFDGSLNDLADALQDLRVLVVFDNLETIGGLDFSTLYEALPDSVTYLITSRVGIGEYERRYPLGKLQKVDSLRLLNDFIRARRVDSLRKLSSGTRAEIVDRLRHSPLVIRWFVLAVEAGQEPVALIRDQREVLEFCVRSVYESLTKPAFDVLAALSVLGRPVTSDELVLLLEKRIDEVNAGLQELIRGSLVRRESTGIPGDLTLLVTLTETASAFFARGVTLDPDLSQRIMRRDTEYRIIEERRSVEAAARSLAPIVVRVRGPQDVPTAQILRNALLVSQSRDFEAALAEIDRARKLNPDFWEVDRVDGFVRAAGGEYASATVAYRSAHAKADEEGKAVVSYFLAGHLSRNLRDVESAIVYAKEAHRVLDVADTAVALGNYLVWTRHFEAGIQLIEPVVKDAEGKLKLIALSSLSQAYRRWASYAADEEKNPALQYQRGRRGLDIALAAIEAGVIDTRLRDEACECATQAILGAAGCLAASLSLAGLGEWLDRFATVLVRLAGARRWPQLFVAITQLYRKRGAPVAAGRLRNLAHELDESGDPERAGVVAAGAVVGEVVSMQPAYGFIRHPRFPSNLFFHRDDLLDSGSMEELRVGTLVRFSVVDTERGPRATNVAKAH